ncbi:alpha/beta fold hydrolase [Nonomuraea soli]|uniref:Pimeloyl-ACP methyl ester carboxylesterase n=1 Tax=Nonomuraea soli TaxID=1032476 RepID=A0A7W0CFR2_9ACTN|nr:alpha/beta hydrolase [Nonomuraea soli]MBA2890174.1 pimeloyl-ACP methyl ester carboxylesterase [Nonomuraea soli]
MTQGAYASVNGIDLHYEVLGTDRPGPPLVMLHGGAYTFRLSFDAILPALTAERKVIGVELQGHGHTAGGDRPFTIKQCADDVTALLDQLGVEAADWFGYSLGGLVATEVAVTDPDRVRRVVLAASHFRATRSESYHRDITDLNLDSPRMPTEGESVAMQRAYDEVAPDPADFLPFVMKVQSTVHDFEGWTDEQLARLTMPVLIIVGDTDFVRLEHVVEVKELPDARLAVLPGTTHMRVIRPDLVVPMVSEFLGE